jgi:hypothetical protein
MHLVATRVQVLSSVEGVAEKIAALTKAFSGIPSDPYAFADKPPTNVLSRSLDEMPMCAIPATQTSQARRESHGGFAREPVSWPTWCPRSERVPLLVRRERPKRV